MCERPAATLRHCAHTFFIEIRLKVFKVIKNFKVIKAFRATWTGWLPYNLTTFNLITSTNTQELDYEYLSGASAPLW